MSTRVPPLQEKLLLVPYVRALEQLSGADVHVRVITPPYPCVGTGELRVVRSSKDGSTVTLDLSYENYERLA